MSDFTYVNTAAGCLYPALMLDVFSRKIVGWAKANQMDATLVEQALRMVLALCQLTTDELLHDTDHGSRYTTENHLVLLTELGIQVSMSGKGDIRMTIRDGEFLQYPASRTDRTGAFPPLHTIRTAVFQLIGVFYNQQRLHSALGFQCPADLDAAHLS